MLFCQIKLMMNHEELLCVCLHITRTTEKPQVEIDINKLKDLVSVNEMQTYICIKSLIC